MSKLDDTGLIDPAGRPTDKARWLIVELRHHLYLVLAGHLDNTGLDCRVQLDDHDCCDTCNMVGAALLSVTE